MLSIRLIRGWVRVLSRHTIKIICRHQQLQTQLRWDIHVRDVFGIFVFLVVVKIFADLLEDYRTTSVSAGLSYAGPAEDLLDVVEVASVGL